MSMIAMTDNDTLVEVYSPANRLQAALLAQMLDAAGIAHRVVNYKIADIAGDVPFTKNWPKVWVAAEDREAATATFEAALRTYGELAALYEQRDDQYALAEVLRYIGYTHWLRGDFVEADPPWQRSASIFSTIGEWRQELSVRQNLAAIASSEGYRGRAAETFRYILERIPPGRDPAFEATVLANLGASSRDFGDIDGALQAYSRALVLRQRGGDATHISAAQRGLGSTYYVSGEYERAQSYLQQALASARAVGDARDHPGVQEAVLLTECPIERHLYTDLAGRDRGKFCSQRFHQRLEFEPRPNTRFKVRILCLKFFHTAARLYRRP